MKHSIAEQAMAWLQFMFASILMAATFVVGIFGLSKNAFPALCFLSASVVAYKLMVRVSYKELKSLYRR